MTDEELLERLVAEEDRLPREAIDEILRRGATLAPRLVKIIETESNWKGDPPSGWAALHATFALAALRPPGSIETICRALEFASEHDWGYVCDEGPSLLAAFAGDSLGPLPSLLHDGGRSRDVREHAGTALVGLAQKHPALRDAAAAAIRTVATDPEEDEDLRAWNAGLLLDLADPQDRELLLSFGENDFFDPQYVKEVYDEGERAQTLDLGDWLRFYDPGEIAARQQEPGEEDVGGFTDDEEEEDLDLDKILPSDPAVDVLEAATADPDAAPPPLRRLEPKVGRNDPCPCGSDKKFKKCCGK